VTDPTVAADPTRNRPEEPPTPFHDLDRYVALPRLAGLALSQDGTRLVTSVNTLDPDGTGYVGALWEVDPAGDRPARRLTRSAKGEGGARFLPGGDLLFVSARPDPDVKADPDDARAALWLLPHGGGEARVVATRPGGVGGPVVARGSGTVVLTSQTLPAAVTGEDDGERRKRRKERKVAAILHESYPIRYWDHDLGPDQPRLFCGQVPAEPDAGSRDVEPARIPLRDLTPSPGAALQEAEVDVTPDGSTLLTTWAVGEPGGYRLSLAAIDTATGEHRLLLEDPDHEYQAPTASPDGRRAAVAVWTRSTPQRPPDLRLALIDLPDRTTDRAGLDGATGRPRLRPVAPGWDRWPTSVVWAPDSSALLVTADQSGRGPVFRIDLGAEPAADTVTRLTADHGCYTDLQVTADGESLYALRSGWDAAPAPVRLDARSADQQPVPLPGPADAVPLPGTLTEVTATAADGTPLRAWLALPAAAGPDRPAPLLLWIHGGPLHSWNSWSWRWNPWLLVARGYAVLLPDPALSTGYGSEMIRRGWGAWGRAPYTDLMTITDAALARPDLDADRTAAMGGSFGGYMANWVAGHTDRFRGIVSHAGLWALDQFGPTTDAAYYWRREMTPQMSTANSPHLSVDAIRTPMLVVHGDKDYRVPIGEALRLWADLSERAGAVPAPGHKFLYFPDENHWVLSPEHAKVWYETVVAFLAATVLGQDWAVPDVLR
jgi:dipeptidyl aminopeptidase/acylaminoacyl peptidase